MRKSKILSFISIILIIACLCSCGGNTANIISFSMPETVKKVETGQIAENDDYSLLWDADSSCVILHNKNNNEIWSSVPYEYYNNSIQHDGYKDLNMMSPIYLVCKSKDKAQSSEHFSEFLSADNMVYSLSLKNGIRVIYLFEDIGVSVPVEYRLMENGLEMRVLVKDIAEKDELVYKVSVMPFFASAPNGEDSYLFVPSGSGAIMNTDEKTDTRSYSEPVYGNDETYQELQQLSVKENVRMPVFGVKRSEASALFGVIDKGSELGVIDATAGDSQLGFSAVYPSFQIRNISETAMKNSSNTTSIVTKVTESKADIDYVSVKYYPLYDNDADYNGMAKAYKSYLKEKGFLKGKEKTNGLFLDLIGGVNVKQSFLGVPYTKVLSATTLEDAGVIAKELSNETKLDSVIKLTGFGKGGIDSRILAGNLKLDSAVGNKKDLTKLNSLCDELSIPLIMNYDLLFYGESSMGYSLKLDCAVNATGLSAKKKRYGLITHQDEYKNENLSMINRSLLGELGDKLIKKTSKLDFDAVSLSTLSEFAYGDGKNSAYIAKNSMAADVSAIIGKIKKQNRRFASENANMYAAVLSDYIFSAPTDSSDYLYFDKNIPFYQMVFKGYIPISSKPINLSNDGREEFLKAMATGSSLEFTLCYNFYDEFINTQHSGLAAGEYKSVKDDIIALSHEAEDVLNDVKGAEIESYKIQNNVSVTEFSNGIKVYVNFGDEVAKTEIGNIEAKSFKYIRG